MSHLGPSPRHGPLFWRVYLHGVLLLLVVGLAVAGVGWALRRGSGWGPGGRPAEYAAARISELAGPAQPETSLSENRAQAASRNTTT